MGKAPRLFPRALHLQSSHQISRRLPQPRMTPRSPGPLFDAVSTMSFARSNSNSLSTRERTRGISPGMARCHCKRGPHMLGIFSKQAVSSLNT
ncbi:hypothetical protein B0T14DRAFT_299097 [Immersiella caudata]|uniref:Uncharacterized protein n=1 Tax=Immersiella caudata TaxID=314043 RepID=A0AA39WEZ6_9PEZI|nr:hypothetical protein B0T14DRAFT_299097 [Immersiella caudata]